MKISNYQVNPAGYYGKFGGAYIPEMLHSNVEELQNNYLKIINSAKFQAEFRDLLKNYAGRPTPLFYAKNLSSHYQTKIYLKREDLLHTGAHKLNNCIGQVLLAEKMGKKRIIAETGAGQHGVATATVCALRDLECVVYMGEVDMQRQKPNVERMRILGAEVRPALSGSRTLKDATNEAIRDWINNSQNTHYIIGSVVGPHPYPDLVSRFQSVISEEIKWQLKEKENKPIKPNNTQKTSPKKTSPPKKAANTFIDFKKIFRQNAKEKATKTTAQQKVIPLNNLKVTDKVVIKDVFVYEGKTSRKSCENYFLFIEQTTKTELRSGNVRVTDNGKQCIYEAGAKKITHNKPTRRYKVYAQSSAKTDPESANPNNNYAFIFLSPFEFSLRYPRIRRGQKKIWRAWSFF